MTTTRQILGRKKSRPLRVSVFGSFYRGESILRTILFLSSKYPEDFVCCGVATDDPFHPRVSPQARVWQYVDDDEKKRKLDVIASLANQYSLSLWVGSIKNNDFQKKFSDWMPDICYMGTFGQLIPPRIFAQPALGFFNLHPTVDRLWPSYIGGNPFKAMLENKETHGVLALHEVDEKFDNGPLLMFSTRYEISDADDAVTLHRRSSPKAGELVERHLLQLVELKSGLTLE